MLPILKECPICASEMEFQVSRDCASNQFSVECTKNSEHTFGYIQIYMSRHSKADDHYHQKVYDVLAYNFNENWSEFKRMQGESSYGEYTTS